jgi:N-ethylmaleimide reductase
VTVPTLQSPIAVGALALPNRIVLAPMTRARAGIERVTGEIVAQYYAQRASAGLLITEATSVAPEGVGYTDTPGIWSDDQVRGWRGVTDAVHAAGGRIFMQLWHVGRSSHSSLQPRRQLPVAPSAIAIEGQTYTYEGMQDYEVPRALETHEMLQVSEQFRRGAQQAKAAGFDGVEVHGANGYLLDQFLQDGSNHRTDEWGGSIANRARLLLDVTKAVVEVWGADRVGVRLSPNGTFNAMSDSDPVATFSFAAEQLGRLGLAYLHVVEPSAPLMVHGSPVSAVALLKRHFGGSVIAAQGYDKAKAEAVLKAGDADLVAFGKAFIANPDLPARLKVDAPLAQWDQRTFYGGGAKGYVDYPALGSAGVA